MTKHCNKRILHSSPTRAALRNQFLTAEQKNYFKKNGAIVSERIAILGQLPLIKNVGEGILKIDEFTVLNSDNAGSMTPIPSPVKFAIGMDARIVIGKNCDLNGAAITAYKAVIIGNRVQIGAGGFISDTDLHPINASTRRKQIRGEPFPINLVQRSEVVIADDVWIGFGVIILKGVHVGHNSIIGAGSVVVSDIPPNCIAAGNPAKVTRRLGTANR